VFEAFFQLLAETSKTAHLMQMFDSPSCGPVFRPLARKGAAKSGARPFAGRILCKIHLKTDFDGLPLTFHLTGGEVSHSTQLKTSLDIGPEIKRGVAMTDKGYDSKANRTACRKRGIVPVITYHSNAKNRRKFFPKVFYKTRARVKQAMVS
jgi:transposase